MSSEFRYIVRMHGTNIPGDKTLSYALSDIKGIGNRIARSIITKLDLDPGQRIGSLGDSDIKLLEDAVERPSKIGLPSWMLNRRKDPRTRRETHLITSDLDTRVKEDIELMKETKSWKGVRHSLGLKVRGQKTKTSARKGRSVGVSRKQVLERTQK